MASAPYVLSVEDTLSTAWKKVKGTKGSVWAAIGIIILFSIGFEILKAVTKAIVPTLEPVVDFIEQVILGLMQIGILYIGIRRAFDLSFSWDMMFRVFDLSIILKIIGLYLLEILVSIPIALLVIAGIGISASNISGATIIAGLFFIAAVFLGAYIMVRLFPAMAFILDKEFNSWLAFKSSFAATRKNFWSIFTIFILQMVILFLSIFPLLGIGLIWSLPFVTILFGEVYKRLLVNVEKT